ncbi:hypothetical protein RV18_GL001752 [Enterococcus termitis]|nr:hypothetical protein RV18_GL001752 [Enterococcus termitis]
MLFSEKIKFFSEKIFMLIYYHNTVFPKNKCYLYKNEKN